MANAQGTGTVPAISNRELLGMREQRRVQHFLLHLFSTESDAFEYHDCAVGLQHHPFRHAAVCSCAEITRRTKPPNRRNFRGRRPINTVRDTSRAIAAGYTAVISNTIVNNFRFGLTRQSQENAGMENGPNVTFRFYDDLHPSINSVSPSTSFTQNFQIPVYNWTDDFSWSKGKPHTQFGTNIRYIQNNRATDIANINFASTNPNYLPDRALPVVVAALDPARVRISGSGSKQSEPL